jgi:hypothetical protein
MSHFFSPFVGEFALLATATTDAFAINPLFHVNTTRTLEGTRSGKFDTEILTGAATDIELARGITPSMFAGGGTRYMKDVMKFKETTLTSCIR